MSDSEDSATENDFEEIVGGANGHESEVRLNVLAINCMVKKIILFRKWIAVLMNQMVMTATVEVNHGHFLI